MRRHPPPWPALCRGRTTAEVLIILITQTARQIDKSNVTKLRGAWSYPARDAGGYVVNPIVVDNVAYVLSQRTSPGVGGTVALG